MSFVWLGRVLVGYVVALALLCWVVHHRASLPPPETPGLVVTSVWQKGELVARRTFEPGEDERHVGTRELEQARDLPGAIRVDEELVGTSSIVTWPDLAFSLSFVGGHDGVVASLGSEVAYVTPDDLLARQAYDRGKVFGAGVSIGVDTPVVWGLLAERLHTTVPTLRARASIRRGRFVRRLHDDLDPSGSEHEVASRETGSPDACRGMLEAARHLARGVSEDGRFRYLLDARTGKTLPGYDWTRHAGATYFLAQAAHAPVAKHEPELGAAALRAAGALRQTELTTCGDAACIGEPRDATVDLGSSALTLLAFAEIVRTGLDPAYASGVRDLARFVRGMQRPDGEFMHEYDRSARHPIDVQYLYYSGEAAFALARAHRVTHDPADLEAARRAVAHLVGPAWSFFGDRYYFGEEHWTCQAMADLWDRAPDARALDFCVRWQRYGRALQYGKDDSPYDADGGYGVGPIVTPRLTPVASRSEAGVATLEVLRQTGEADEARLLEAQLSRSLLLLNRRQLLPGPIELFADAAGLRGPPASSYGAIPSSEVDLTLRIDYAQHAGSAFARWCNLGQEALP